MNLLSWIFCSWLLVPCTGFAELFWNADRSRSFEGEFLKSEGDQHLFLRAADGKKFTLSSAQLAPESLEKIRRIALLNDTLKLFKYRDGVFQLAVLPDEFNLRKVQSALSKWDAVSKNRKFLKRQGEHEFGVNDRAMAFDCKWLNRDWVLVAEFSEYPDGSMTPEFSFHLPASSTYTKGEIKALNTDLREALETISGLKAVPIDFLWKLEPTECGTAEFFKAKGPMDGVRIGFYQYPFHPKPTIRLVTYSYGKLAAGDWR